MPIYYRDDSYPIGEYLHRRGFFAIMAAASPPGRRLRVRFMATVVRHRKVNIVVLDAGDQMDAHCKPGDIAIVTAADGWWNFFFAADGSAESYDRPYKSYNEALWAAKAAAEFGFS